MVTVEQLYKNFGNLADAKDKAGEHEVDFLSILGAVKGGPGEKRLASQFIARFFKYFPKLSHQAINALFDLCEDEDVNIRKQAIKDLPSLCKINTEHVPKIAEALTQLLQCDDATELSLVQSSLLQLFTLNAKGAAQGIFSQLLGEDEAIREKSLKFLATKLKSVPEDAFNKDTQDLIIAECKKVLQDVTKDEFIAIMNILRFLPTMGTVQGRQQMVDIVTEQAELDQPFKASDADCVDRFISCVRHVVSLFSKNVHSKTFVGYMCDHVLPSLHSLVTDEEGTDIQLEVLKLFAEIVEFAGDMENIEERLQHVFDVLLEYMPLPPSEENQESVENEEPKLCFSYVECLMYGFHQLGRKSPEFLTDEKNAEKLKDFRIRLQYFARGVQIYIKQLRQDLQGKTGDALKLEENKIKVVALKITSNINSLIKDLFHNPPAYKCVVNLSWKPIQPKSTARQDSKPVIGEKRFTPVTFEANGVSQAKKLNRQEREIYHPPSGKFSEKAGTFQTGGVGRGRGGGGGFNRNRGRGRGSFRGRY
ncbi:hypothetical protein ACJMK2_020427 [Sinanodonta woodiana]|uniref:Apoptosis inhibitor 5 n=1 Tax=Sinanodonta woodiana TaxID=1069815 RepID=A0ABD3U1A7_SINWO